MASGNTSLPASSLEPGHVIGERYRVLAELGSGGMGTVYKVEHTLMAKEMALKLLRPELGAVPQIAERFEREARSASRLDDVHIVRVTDFGRAPDGAPYLVMELLEGEPLSARIARGDLSPVEALEILDQILAALEHAHHHGVIHRDLKPDNIMLVPKDGRTIVKILDFGLAKLTADREGTPNLTQTGMIFGTPRYMAPEQAAGEPIDARTDLYAVGVLAYELLSGKTPFDAPTAVEILSAHLTQAPPPLVLPGAPADLEARLSTVVLRALEKHKRDRFQSAAELREALSVLWPDAGLELPSPLGRAPSGPRGAKATGLTDTALRAPERAPTPAPEPHPRPARRRAWVLAGIALFVALVVIARSGATGIERAEEALAKGDLPAARAVLATLLAEQPGDARVQLLAGHLAFAEDDADGTAQAYERALELDGAIAGDAVLAANTRRLLEKNQRAGGRLITALALHAGSPGAPLLAELAEKAPVQRMRSHAFQALERLGETSRLDLFTYLSGELDQVRAESCKSRKWYIERLAGLDDPRVLAILERERSRKGGILNLEDVNGCMATELEGHIAKHKRGG